MKKFKFTLGRMLDYKDQLLTEEKNKLAVVRKRQSDLEQRIDSLENESCRISEEMNRGQKKGIAVFQLVAFQAQRARHPGGFQARKIAGKTARGLPQRGCQGRRALYRGVRLRKNDPRIRGISGRSIGPFHPPL